MERRDVPSFLAARRFPLASVLAIALVRPSYRQMFRCFGSVIVPDDSIATVSKTVVWFGSHRDLPSSGIVALLGQRRAAGLSARARPGVVTAPRSTPAVDQLLNSIRI